jgi:hypothetical protein
MSTKSLCDAHSEDLADGKTPLPISFASIPIAPQIPQI